jgi:hypothetical protein
MRFYERLGFGPTGERRRIPAHPEGWETLLVRRIALDYPANRSANRA